MQAWLSLIGMSDEFVRVREHDADELSHYSSRTIDFEYNFPGPMGWKELYGLANRTDFDLPQHQKFSGEDLQYFDQAKNRNFLPHVIEPTFGVDRTCLILLLDAYDEEETVDVNGKPDTRVVLRLHPRVAPYKAAVLPLMKKPSWRAGRSSSSAERHTRRPRRLRRDRQHRQALPPQDEIGTPFCFTIDYETLDDPASPFATATT